MHPVVDGIHYRLYDLEDFSDTGYICLTSALLRALQYSFIVDLFLRLPKLLIYEILEILVDLLHHHHPFQPGPCFLGHKTSNQLKLIGDSLQIPTLQLKIDDPT